MDFTLVYDAESGEHVVEAAENAVRNKCHAFIHNDRLYEVEVTWKHVKDLAKPPPMKEAYGDDDIGI